MAKTIIKQSSYLQQLQANSHPAVSNFFQNINVSDLKTQFFKQYDKSINKGLQMIPTIKNNKEKFKNDRLLPSIANFYSLLQINRKILYDLLQQEIIDQIQDYQIHQLINIYKYFVLLRHQDNHQFQRKLTTTLYHKVLSSKGIRIQKNYYTIGSLMRYMLMDPNLLQNDKQTFIEAIAKHLCANIAKNKLLDKKYTFLNADLYQYLLIKSIKKPQEFIEIVKKSYDEYSVSLQHFKENKRLKYAIEKKKSYYASVFERVFENNLQKYGYKSERNVRFKINEYDFLITGKFKEKHCPFANIDIFNVDFNEQPRIPLEKLKHFEKQSETGWISKDTPIDKVILELNGPQHYINQQHSSSQLVLSEEYKMLKLKLYGIKKYNLISSVEWQKISVSPINTEKYLNEKIMKTINIC